MGGSPRWAGTCPLLPAQRLPPSPLVSMDNGAARPVWAGTCHLPRLHTDVRCALCNPLPCQWGRSSPCGLAPAPCSLPNLCCQLEGGAASPVACPACIPLFTAPSATPFPASGDSPARAGMAPAPCSLPDLRCQLEGSTASPALPLAPLAYRCLLRPLQPPSLPVGTAQPVRAGTCPLPPAEPVVPTGRQHGKPCPLPSLPPSPLVSMDNGQPSPCGLAPALCPLPDPWCQLEGGTASPAPCPAYRPPL